MITSALPGSTMSILLNCATSRTRGSGPTGGTMADGADEPLTDGGDGLTGSAGGGLLTDGGGGLIGSTGGGLLAAGGGGLTGSAGGELLAAEAGDTAPPHWSQNVAPGISGLPHVGQVGTASDVLVTPV